MTDAQLNKLVHVSLTQNTTKETDKQTPSLNELTKLISKNRRQAKFIVANKGANFVRNVIVTTTALEEKWSK